jgi:hypothetical protein
MATNYRWCCTACGLANEGDATACGACTCPACPTARQIAACRERHVQRGGAPQGDAAVSAQRDLSAFDVLGRPLLIGLAVLFGWM